MAAVSDPSHKHILMHPFVSRSPTSVKLMEVQRKRTYDFACIPGDVAGFEIHRGRRGFECGCDWRACRGVSIGTVECHFTVCDCHTKGGVIDFNISILPVM